MTTPLKSQLLALLTRRSHQAREDATRDLRQLQAIIETIERAGVMASCPLKLPTEITHGIPKRLSRVSQLSYVLAVGESVQAKSQGKSILEAAQQQLTAEIKSWKQAGYELQMKINELKAAEPTKKETLKANAQEDRASALSRLHDSSFNESGFCALVGCGVVGFVIVGLFFWFISYQHSHYGQPKSDPTPIETAPWWSAFVCCGVPVSLIAGVMILLRLLTVSIPNMFVHRRLRKIDRRLRAAFSRLGRELPKDLAALEKRLSSARTSEQKARAALDWLQGQYGL